MEKELQKTISHLQYTAYKKTKHCSIASRPIFSRTNDGKAIIFIRYKIKSAESFISKLKEEVEEVKIKQTNKTFLNLTKLPVEEKEK